MTIAKVMVAPLNYSHLQDGQYWAFGQVFGDEVQHFDYMGMSRAGLSNHEITKRFVDTARLFQPDWIWLQVQGSDVIQPWGINEIKQQQPKCLVTHWMGDARTSVPHDLATMCQVTDATLISSVGQIPLYRNYAKRVEYVQIGLDWHEDVLGEPPWTPPFRVPDVVFCGGFYGRTFERGSQERLAAIRALVEAGIDVGVVGTGWPSDIPVVGECHVKQQHHVYKRAKVALSINHFNDIELYYSDRQLIAMASGTPVVCRYVPGLEREFKSYFDDDGGDCIWWRKTEELVAWCRELIAKPDIARMIGIYGREEVIANHTWEARIRQLLPKVEAWRTEMR